MMGMKQDCGVLDLGCGGGLFADHFYSSQAKSIVSGDFDPTVIAHAQANFKAPNVKYVCADIRTGMPEGDFDNVIWDAAIEQFTLEEIDAIVANIKRRIAARSGMFAGYTIVEMHAGKSLSNHKYQFKSKEELAELLKRSFSNFLGIQITTRDYMEVRYYHYFYAADHELPFDPGWERLVRL